MDSKGEQEEVTTLNLFGRKVRREPPRAPPRIWRVCLGEGEKLKYSVAEGVLSISSFLSTNDHAP